MRKGILYFFLFFCNSLFSQNINPFKLDYVDWEILSCSWWSSPPPDRYYFNHYKLCGDTVYQGQTYKRILEGSTMQFAPFPGAGPTYTMTPPSNYSFYGFFRQDSVLKRNYLRLSSWSHDSLLMDYNLQVGDTIKTGLYYHQAPSCNDYVVLAIDSILISGYKFRRFYTDSLGGMYLKNYTAGYFFVEGLGHINGMFEEPMFEEFYCHPFENCPGVDTIRFNAATVGMTQYERKFNLEIHPNPTTNRITLNSGSQGVVCVYTSIGQTVLKAKVDFQKEVDVTGLPPGIYFIELISEEKRSSAKFIKE